MFLHEMGHAVSLLVLTGDDVAVYIGSMGDKTHCVKIPMPRTDIWVKLNPVRWNSGLCVPNSKNLSIDRQIIYVAMGPVVSLLLMVVPFLIILYTHIPDAAKAFLYFLCLSAVVDFFSSAFPRPGLIRLKSGKTTYNDASRLLQLISHKRYEKEMAAATALYSDKNYQAATEQFEKFLSAGWRYDHMLRMAIYSYLQLKNNERAEAFDKVLQGYCDLTSDDLIRSGCIKYNKGDLAGALLDFEHSLQMAPGYDLAIQHINMVKTAQQAIGLTA